MGIKLDKVEWNYAFRIVNFPCVYLDLLFSIETLWCPIIMALIISVE